MPLLADWLNTLGFRDKVKEYTPYRLDEHAGT